MTISVCMIVLNEEQTLERILKTVKQFADEIIIVDTGSVDDTVNIAKKFTDKIYKFAWVNDFSLARNFAFSKASCDYLMWLDADDYISNKNVNKIRQLKKRTAPADTYMFKYSCFSKQEKAPIFTFYRERLLKNCKSCVFKGFIHEVIIPFGKIEYLDIEIEHRKVKNNNPKRNLKIYQAHDFKSLSPRDKFYCAKEYYYNGYYKTAIKKLKAFLLVGEFLPNVYDAYITLYDCLVKIQDISAVKYLYKCIEKCGLTSEVLCKIGDNLLNKNDYASAIKYYKCALSCAEPKNSLFFVKKEYYYLYPLLQLTYAFYKLGDLNTSLRYHKMAYNRYKNDYRVAKNQEFFNSNLK